MSNSDLNHHHQTEEEMEEDDEYGVWRKNAPFLYDELISHALEWPSLTVHSLHLSYPKPDTNSLPLLLGTHTSDGSPNFLMIATARFPSIRDDDEARPLVQIERRIPHASGEVNRARHMPQNPSLIATKTCGDEVHLFLLSSKDDDDDNGPPTPSMVLKGHTKEGYGICWNPFREGYLLSGSYDSRICLWDLNANPNNDNNNVLDAKDIYEVHKDLVEDVCWHLKNENVFGSVGDDHMLMIWDLRSASKQPEQSISAHQNVVNSLSFSPFSEWILATASADTTINLFDLRKLGTSLHTFSSHMEEVIQVDWSPYHETILASCGVDKKLMVWDLSRIGDEQSPEDADDGPPELLFVHGGHTAKISEFSWNPSREWVISSVDEDNILQVWQMAESIYRDDHETPHNIGA